MAAIPVRTFATLTQNFAAGVQGRARQLIDFSVGAVLRAVAEATADLTLWIQGVIVYVLTLTRAATSKGADLDTWMADWFFTRLPTVAATGRVTVSRFSANVQIVVPIGTQVQTQDGSLIFAVYADTSLSAYSASLGGYVLPAGILTFDVPVQAVLPSGSTNGSAWNVVAGQINQVRSSDAYGIDAVTNAVAFTTGRDAESDPSFRARFQAYISALARGTRIALNAAISNLQQGLQTAFLEFQQKDGTPDDGMNVVFVDDGSGNPSVATVQAAAAAVNGYRAFGVRIGVFGASLLAANAQMTITIDPAYSPPMVKAAVVAALAAYINGLGMGVPLRFTRLEQIAYGASPGVTNVSALTLNGGTVDLVPTAGQTIKANNLLVGTTV